MTWSMFVVCLLSSSLLPAVRASGQTLLSDSQKLAITSAIEDEIYDYSLQASFRSVGKSLANNTVEVPIYVTQDSKPPNFFLIYRLMPYGEMYRLATASPDGFVRLFRNPNVGFPPDAPATSTVYYDDDVICHAKAESLRLSFLVELNPSSQRLEEAIVNQKRRYGFSNLARKEKKKTPTPDKTR